MNIEDLRPGRHVQHRKGGKYVVVGVGRLEWDPEKDVVVYRPVMDDSLWVRPLSEFLDGRFNLIEGDLG